MAKTDDPGFGEINASLQARETVVVSAVKIAKVAARQGFEWMNQRGPGTSGPGALVPTNDETISKGAE
ncbi:hypothetical protein [Brevundimonas sp. TWP2-3-2]|uniref:hypothetical protein n=1 Tax=Brevundimonas sp. TWP2-3-2 TaxID=2804648 RepID=UPI003CEC4989